MRLAGDDDNGVVSVGVFVVVFVFVFVITGFAGLCDVRSDDRFAEIFQNHGSSYIILTSLPDNNNVRALSATLLEYHLLK